METETAGAVINFDPLKIIMLIGMAVMLVILIIFGKRFSRIKVGPGGIELDANGNPVDPKSPCPYIDSHGKVLKDVERLNEKLDLICVSDKKQETEIKSIHGKLDSICFDMAAANKSMCSIMADQTKQIFYNSSLPLIERLVAGLKYITMGNNEAVKKDVTAMAAANAELYEGIIKLRPDLSLD